MTRSRAIRIGVAATVAGAGLAAGGVGIAAAADDGSSPRQHPAAAGEGGPEHGPDGPWGGPGRGHGPDGLPGVEARLADLATALGVSEDDLRDALRAVRDDLRPQRPAAGSRPAPPSEADRKALQDKLAAALAEELDLSEAKVSAAIEKQRDAAVADRRAELEQRLESAVDDGDLTAADQASVLKAYDLGVLGGPLGPRP